MVRKVNRIVVAGALGFFGSMVVRILHDRGSTPLIASRRAGGDLILDVENRASIRAAIRSHDVIVDATAPFQKRSTTLVDEAIAVGADVIDLSDSLGYATLIVTCDAAARQRGVRVLNACSAVSVLSSFAIERSGIYNPVALHGFLAPATRHTANPGVTASLLASVGRPIQVLRDGKLISIQGWSEAREFAAVRRRGRLMEMADTITLPRVYPSLRDVDFWVDPNVPGAGMLLPLIARVPALARYGTPLARVFGSSEGILAYEIEGPAGERTTVVFTGRESFLTAAIPAALAALRLASGEPCPPGIVFVDRHVDADALAAALTRYGIIQRRSGRSRRSGTDS
jgi:hypothetical protein